MEDEGGLAGTVRAEQRDTLATPDGEVDAEEGLVAVGVGRRPVRPLPERGSQGPSQQADDKGGEREGEGVDHHGALERGHLVDDRHIEPAYPRLTMARWTRSPAS